MSLHHIHCVFQHLVPPALYFFGQATLYEAFVLYLAWGVFYVLFTLNNNLAIFSDNCRKIMDR